MRRIAVLVVLACGALPVPAAQGGVPSTPFAVTPAAPTTTSPITATWKVDRKVKRGATFGFQLMVDPSPSGTGVPGTGCAVEARIKPRVVRKGRMLRMVFRPGQGVPSAPRVRNWCTGVAGLVLFRYDPPLGPGFEPTEHFLGKRTVTIGAGSDPGLPFSPTPAKVTILPGSTITASAPGRADRSTPVSGVLRGATRTPFALNRDNSADAFIGPVQLASFAPDPLCPGTAPPAATDVVGGSRLDIGTDGSVRFTLSLNGSPSQVFGCGPAGRPAGATTFPLTGTVGPTGLQQQTLTGTVPGIVLPDGTQGGLAANLTVSIDLSGTG